MPLYTFRCRDSSCNHEEEVLCPHRIAALSITHDPHLADIYDAGVPSCPVHHEAGTLVWRGVETPTLDFTGNMSGRFQTKAIMSTGQKVAGQFGKSAPTRVRGK